MIAITEKQFALLAKLLRSHGPVTAGARYVLLGGLGHTDAARKASPPPPARALSAQSVANAVARFKAAHESVLSVYLADQTSQ